jgi:hypothetical protein
LQRDPVPSAAHIRASSLHLPNYAKREEEPIHIHRDAFLRIGF